VKELREAVDKLAAQVHPETRNCFSQNLDWES
jgi:hypothetical protein